MIPRLRTGSFVFGHRDQRGRVLPLNGQTSLALDFTLGQLSGVTFTRTGTTGLGQTGCTYIDSSGNFQLVGADVPRLNCPFGGGSVRGLLIEEQRVNLCLRTGWTGNTNISTPPTGWTFPFGTGTSASEASLYGSNDGASAIRQTASGNRPFLNQSFSLTNGVTYVMSFHLEAITSGTPQYQDLLLPTAGTGSIGAITYYRNGSSVSASATAAAGRIWAVFTCTGSGTVSMRVGLGCASGITANVLISRPQVEASDWPSSYIPTAGAAITRPADFAYVMASVLPFTVNGGTVVVGYYRGEGASKTLSPLGIMTDGGDLIFVANHTGGSADHDTTDGSTTLASSDGQSGVNRAAYAWGEGITASSYSLNGNTAVTGDLNPPTGFTKVRLGGQRSTRVLGQEITSFAAYPTRLADSELEALTA
jgi:hypothetical protein